MIAVKQLKTGAMIDVQGAPHVVESIVKSTPSARGASTLYHIRARNVLTQSKTDLTCKGDDTYAQPDLQTREVQFLYSNGPEYTFMDLESYDQYALDEELVGTDRDYLIEDMDGIYAMILDGRVVALRLPDVVEQQLVECDPAIKGASATARTKPATTQTGLIVQVPEYMSNGETVRIDTRTGKFLSRAT